MVEDGSTMILNPDVIMLGDDNEESESEDSVDSETSFESSENSEDKSSDTQSGEEIVYK